MKKWITLIGLLISSAVHADKPVVLFLVGEAEYGTRQTLPEFAKNELGAYDCRFVFAESDDRKDPGVNVFPGLKKALDEADLLFLSVRRRYPSDADMKEIKYWFHDGKPMVGIRTSSHPFGERGKAPYLAPKGHGSWNNFDEAVLGAKYTGHYNAKDGHAVVSLDAKTHPILKGVEGGFEVSSHLYKNALDKTVKRLASGEVNGNREPVAWTREKDGQRIFYTSLGGVEDMAIPAVRKMLVNAVAWALEKDPEVNLVPAKDLEVEVLAEDPVVAQPSFLNFDERGRMWVVQYRQYPEPAGVRRVSKDRYWRAAYNRLPHPPGHPDYVPGKDRITIHEDCDGDGSFETVKTFLDGLNLVTSCAQGNGGVYVLQPPYLLFYRDQDEDDVPDGKPEVLLEGLGIEDTHSICSSLCWGPDGWLYASQGSTVSGAVKVPGSDAEPVRSVGQLMWRYHPFRKQYEIFAEGGGNIWSAEFDAQGRLFAGSNGGAPGFFYLPGAYYSKNFSKHGELSNPYAYGYFSGIDHPGFKRVSTNILIYEADALPERYHGALIACNPVLRQFRASTLEQNGLGYKGAYLDHLVTPRDNLFRPVYADVGPDGALYICDWVDTQVNHYRNHEGQIRKRDGKLLRITRKGAAPIAPFDLRKKSSLELVELLAHPHRWWRETARRVLADREDRATVIPRLREMLEGDDEQQSLEALWALHVCGGLGELDRWIKILKHPNPQVRAWMIRFLSDDRHLGSSTFWRYQPYLVAEDETELEVWGAVASAALRSEDLDLAKEVLPKLIAFNDRAKDPHLNLMTWWALERYQRLTAASPAWLEEAGVLELSFFREQLAPKVVRKLVEEGTIEGLAQCSWWIRKLGDPAVDALHAAMKGNFIRDLPLDLVEQLVAARPDDLPLRVRAGFDDAASQALNGLESGRMDAKALPELMQALSRFPSERLADALVQSLGHAEQAVRIAAVESLAALPGESASVGGALVDAFIAAEIQQERDALRGVLAGRVAWAKMLVAGATDPAQLPADTRLVLRGHEDAELSRALDALIGSTSPGADDAEARRLLALAKRGGGDPYAGRELYLARCGSCHYLHNEGGEIGPDLTPYQRGVPEDLLAAILHPSDEIREGYEMVTVELSDGRILSGFLAEQGANKLVLRQPGGLSSNLPVGLLEKMHPAGVSMMPQGLLADLDDDAVQNLFSYLRSSQPLNVKKK